MSGARVALGRCFVERVKANLTDEGREPEWFTAGVRGVGGASLLFDLGHEVPTLLLSSLLTSTLRAPAAALGVIEGIADGVAGIARRRRAR